MLQDDEGRNIKDEEALKQHIVDFYRSLLGTSYARDSIEVDIIRMVLWFQKLLVQD